jgi:hypothetical protein
MSSLSASAGYLNARSRPIKQLRDRKIVTTAPLTRGFSGRAHVGDQSNALAAALQAFPEDFMFQLTACELENLRMVPAERLQARQGPNFTRRERFVSSRTQAPLEEHSRD